MNTCRLCKKEKVLIKKSHIIPDFFYREVRLYDEKHKVHLFTANSKTNQVAPFKKQSTGIYEKHILCEKCDNEIIGGYETYLKSLLFGGPVSESTNPDFKKYLNQNGKNYLICSNISYPKTKLGLLSLLWRASITKQGFFSKIKLDNDVEEELRKMILESDPKENHRYPVVCLYYTHPDSAIFELLAEPRDFKHHRGSGYALLVGGMLILFYLEHTFNNDELVKYSLTNDSILTIVEIPEDEAHEWISAYLNVKI